MAHVLGDWSQSEKLSEYKPPLLPVLLTVKFIYSEKATKFCEIFPLLLSYVVPVKSNVEILQNFVAFSEYINFNGQLFYYKFKIIALAAKLYFENTG